MSGVFRNRWWIVAASVFGLMCSAGVVNIFSFGVFLRPVTESLHVGRATLAGALLVQNLITAASGPFLGTAIDRWGARRVFLIGIPFFALTVAVQSQMTGALLVIYLFFVLRGLGGIGQSPISYAYVVAKWFDRRRGLALGIALAGVGLGTSVVPPIVAYLIGAYGWRAAYIGLALVILVISGIPVAIFIRDPAPDEHVRVPDLLAGPLPGLTLREAIAGWRFWGLTVAFLLGVVALNGTITQVVAMLQDRGVPLQAATSVLAVSGLAAMAGRLISGLCVDRFPAPYVGICFFILPMIGTALFGSGAGGWVPYAGSVLCGVALGAEIDLMGFMVSRYFGLKSYGKIFGTMFGIFGGSTGIGPYLSGLSFDLYHSYLPAFAFYEFALVAICLIFLPLGPYRFPSRHQIVAPAAVEGAPA